MRIRALREADDRSRFRSGDPDLGGEALQVPPDRVTTEVVRKQPGDIPRSQGKAVRVRDLRARLG